MKIDNPKFCVHEPVGVVSVNHPEQSTDRTEVTASKYFDNDGLIDAITKKPSLAGWKYKTTHQPNRKTWWNESSLRKIQHGGPNSLDFIKTLGKPSPIKKFKSEYTDDE